MDAVPTHLYYAKTKYAELAQRSVHNKARPALSTSRSDVQMVFVLLLRCCAQFFQTPILRAQGTALLLVQMDLVFSHPSSVQTSCRVNCEFKVS